MTNTTSEFGFILNPEEYTSGLKLRDGIYFPENISEISYPESGNEHCFQIEQNSFWFNHRNNCITTAVRQFSPDSVFFDVGGGNGFVSSGLQKLGFRTVLVEPGIQGCRNAKKRNLTNVICATLEDANFLPESIPSVGIFDVLEHIKNDVAFLKNIHSYTKENGYLYITVPAFNSLWSNEDEDTGHFRRYTLKSLSDKLQEAGFKVQYATYIFSILPLPVLLARAIPSRLGLNKKSSDIQKHKKEHSQKSGMVSAVLNKVWNLELRKIKSQKPIPMGGSCFIVAKK